MDTINENCGLPYDRCYYPHRLRDSLSPVGGIFRAELKKRSEKQRDSKAFMVQKENTARLEKSTISRI